MMALLGVDPKAVSIPSMDTTTESHLSPTQGQ